MKPQEPRKTHSTPFKKDLAPEGRFPIDALLDVQTVQASNPRDQTKPDIETEIPLQNLLKQNRSMIEKQWQQ